MKTSLVSRVRDLLKAESEGNALVEMAVTLPVILLILTGIVSFSTLLYQKLQLAEAVNNAGHYIATARGASDPCASAYSALYASSPGLSSTSLSVTLSQNGNALPSSCPTPSGGAGTLVQGATVSVNATYASGLSVYGTQYTAITLGSQVSEVVQ